MKTNFKTIAFILLFFWGGITSFAQGYKNNWYFGNGVALDFTSGSPSNVSGGSSINSYNHATSMSDASGNLLFYSDSKNIWNSSNTAISLTGTYLLGNDNNSQGISFQNPADQSQYYYFYLGDPGAIEGKTSADATFYYSIIETDNAPTLTMVAEDVSVTCSACTSDPYSEALTAVPHCNGMDYWVIVHGDEELIVYLVDATGVSEAGVYDFNLPPERGILKASPDATMIALSISHTTNGQLTLYDFNNVTGVISNELVLSSDSYNGISFSPNSEVLYAINSTDLELEAYTLTVTTPYLYNTATISNILYNMQLAKDGKIYINKGGSGSTMGVINTPNNISSFGLNETGLTVSGVPNNSIPNFVDAERPTPLTAVMSGGGNICSTGSTTVTVTLTGTAPWDIVYNDGINNITITGITSSPYTITATSIGTYSLVSVNSGDAKVL